jgi:hypothetical protein
MTTHPTTDTTGTPISGSKGHRDRSRDGPVPAALVALSFIPLAAGAQILTEGFGQAVLGTGEFQGDLAKGAGWVLNLAVAEWTIRRSLRKVRS